MCERGIGICSDEGQSFEGYCGLIDRELKDRFDSSVAYVTVLMRALSTARLTLTKASDQVQSCEN